MNGLMQDSPLLISSLIDFAAQYHGDVEVVSRSIEGPIHRTNYAEIQKRSKRLANALQRLGLERGDRVATLAWNGYRHLELYYGVSGAGYVLHTLNPRLFPEQLSYIVNHAEDKYIFVDLTFMPLIEKMASHFGSVRGFVVMTDREHMPKTALDNVFCYEELLDAESDELKWPTLDESTASSLCYTSGTTGNPKGVLYSHRSTVLHSWSACMLDTIGLSSRDVILPVVPMFHANAWGITYSAAMCGAKLVLPGAGMDGANLYELLDTEQVTVSAGVPTIWMGLLAYLQQADKTLPHMNRTIIGGSAAPASMIEAFETQHDVTVVHAWGMTETSPIGTVGVMKSAMMDKPLEQQLPYKVKQGRAVYGVDLKIVDETGKELPRDGVAFGSLLVRGPWVTGGYFKGEGGQIVDEDGWFDTGDVATLDPEGFMQITDRSKDLIKSGGEWISSIELENVAVGHSDIQEAAVIGMPHDKWGERPVVVAIRREGSALSREDLLAFMSDKVAKWSIPDDVVFVEELPHTATGKLSKLNIRKQFADYKWPS
jgi:acyl-CoA synthetase (AMP-forming)/AMP-acid ligase II